jgi:hypothetical protein
MSSEGLAEKDSWGEKQRGKFCLSGKTCLSRLSDAGKYLNKNNALKS